MEIFNSSSLCNAPLRRSLLGRARKNQGLINKIAAPAELDAMLETLLQKILAKPPVALAMGKELFYMQLETGIEKAYEYAAQTMACNMMDNSALEGVQAFIEKRKPNWT